VHYDVALRNYAILSAIGIEAAADNLGFLIERGHGRGFLGPPFAFGALRILDAFASKEAGDIDTKVSGSSSDDVLHGPGSNSSTDLKSNYWRNFGLNVLGRGTVIGDLLGFGLAPFDPASAYAGANRTADEAVLQHEARLVMSQDWQAALDSISGTSQHGTRDVPAMVAIATASSITEPVLYPSEPEARCSNALKEKRLSAALRLLARTLTPTVATLLLREGGGFNTKGHAIETTKRQLAGLAPEWGRAGTAIPMD